MASRKERPVAIVMGSKSDQTTMVECKKILNYFNIGFDEFILSAHRTPRATAKFAENAEANGYQVLIAAAGMAAHLPGVVAAYTTLPVIGIPMPGSDLHGVDALYSVVQMPSGVPVAAVAIGKAGAANSAILAAQILSLQDAELKQRLLKFKEQGCRV
ncbi:MAG: 5-(carboxyamino)imidazole ribonucleotide mutase [Anaerolineae bacterium]